MQVNKAARKSCPSELFKSGQTPKVKMRQKLLGFFFFLTLWPWLMSKNKLWWVPSSSEFVIYYEILILKNIKVSVSSTNKSPKNVWFTLLS